MAIDDARDAVFHKFIAEVKKVTQLEPRQLEVGKQLFLVDRKYIFDRLKLQNDFVAYNDVRSKAFVEYQSIEVDWHGNLTLD